MADDSSTRVVPTPTLTTIIDSKFCMPFEVDLIIARKLSSLVEGNVLVTDLNGNIIFRVRTASSSGQHTRHVLQDAASHPIVSLHHKILTAHKRWQAFKGDASSDHHHLMFSARKSSVMPTSRADIDVYLADNTKEHVSDFKIKESWPDRSRAIYSGNGTTPIAQTHKEHPRTHMANAGKDVFSVKVCPNVDYAFVFALIIIMEEIYEENSDCITQESTLPRSLATRAFA